MIRNRTSPVVVAAFVALVACGGRQEEPAPVAPPPGPTASVERREPPAPARGTGDAGNPAPVADRENESPRPAAAPAPATEPSRIEAALRSLLEEIPADRRPSRDGWDPIARARAARWLGENVAGRTRVLFLPIEKAEVVLENEEAGLYKVTAHLLPFILRMDVNGASWRIRVRFPGDAEAWLRWWTGADERFARLLSDADAAAFDCTVEEAALPDAAQDPMEPRRTGEVRSGGVWKPPDSDARLSITIRPVGGSPDLERLYLSVREAGLGRRIELKPDDAALRIERGDVRQEMGDHPGALSDYLAAIRLDPDQALGYGKASFLLASSWVPGVPDGPLAVRLAQRYLDLARDNDAEATVIVALLRAGDYGGAGIRLAAYEQRHGTGLPVYAAAMGKRSPWTATPSKVALLSEPRRDDAGLRQMKENLSALLDAGTPAQEYVDLLAGLRRQLDAAIDWQVASMGVRNRDRFGMDMIPGFGEPFPTSDGPERGVARQIVGEARSRLVRLHESARWLPAGDRALPDVPGSDDDPNRAWWALWDFATRLEDFIERARIPTAANPGLSGAELASRLARLKAFLALKPDGEKAAGDRGKEPSSSGSLRDSPERLMRGR